MDEVSATHRNVAAGRVQQFFQTYRTFGRAYVFDTLVIFIGVRHAVPTFEAMSHRLSCTPTAHLAVVLPRITSTQWKMSFTLFGLFSYNLHFRQL